MKLLPQIKVLIRYFGILMVVLMFVFVSCSDDDNAIQENWTYIGLRHVNVDSVNVPDAIQSTDTLEIYMSGDVFDADRPIFSHVEEVRDSFQVDLKLWAKAYAWSGSGPMPPTSFTVYCTHKILPPFYPDTFVVNVHCPDSSDIKKEIHIID